MKVLARILKNGCVECCVFKDSRSAFDCYGCEDFREFAELMRICCRNWWLESPEETERIARKMEALGYSDGTRVMQALERLDLKTKGWEQER